MPTPKSADVTKKRGRPAGSKSAGLRPNELATSEPTIAKPTKAKLGYKVFIMKVSDELTFASVTNGDDYTQVYMRISGNGWQKMLANTAMYDMVEKSFRKRDSGALHIASFMALEDVSLPMNYINTTPPVSDNSDVLTPHEEALEKDGYDAK